MAAFRGDDARLFGSACPIGLDAPPHSRGREVFTKTICFREQRQSRSHGILPAAKSAPHPLQTYLNRPTTSFSPACLLPQVPLLTAHERDPADLPILVPLVCTGGQGPTFVAKPEAASSGRLSYVRVFDISNPRSALVVSQPEGARDDAQPIPRFPIRRFRRDFATRDATASTAPRAGVPGNGQIRRSAT